jgi:endonuclease/exonuclease/phosphatase (EEP) superfamily protein YafD
MRQESMRQLLLHIEAMQRAYGKLGTITWIVGGDFNTSLDDKRFANETTLHSLMDNGFAWIWQNVPLASRTTLPRGGGFPAACFDHIFYRGAKLRRASVVNTSRQSSDHRAIVATFDLPAAK